METLQLRSAQPEDALAVARVHVRSWQAGYRGLLPDAYLDGLKPEERAQRYSFGSPDPSQPTTTVALIEDTICGFATIAPARDPDSMGAGELCGLYVDPGWWGRGVGGVLLELAHARLTEWGFRDAILWVLAGNVRAERLYRQHGWLPGGTRRTAEIWGIEVQEERYLRKLT